MVFNRGAFMAALGSDWSVDIKRVRSVGTCCCGGQGRLRLQCLVLVRSLYEHIARHWYHFSASRGHSDEAMPLSIRRLRRQETACRR